MPYENGTAVWLPQEYIEAENRREKARVHAELAALARDEAEEAERVYSAERQNELAIEREIYAGQTYGEYRTSQLETAAAAALEADRKAEEKDPEHQAWKRRLREEEARAGALVEKWRQIKAANKKLAADRRRQVKDTYDMASLAMGNWAPVEWSERRLRAFATAQKAGQALREGDRSGWLTDQEKEEEATAYALTDGWV